jgi:PEP-CTERM motif
MRAKLRSLCAVAMLVLPGPLLAAVTDTSLPLNISWNGAKPTPDDKTWVNTLFRDFSGAGQLNNFEWIRNTVELQVTTDSLLHGSAAPVQGFGHLANGEDVKSLWLNFNPNKDISQLKVYYTGDSMAPGVPTNADKFPDAGLRPSSILSGSNFDKAGPDGRFDIRVDWDSGGIKLGPADSANSFSKLLLVYKNGAEDISPSDFFFNSAPAPGSKFGPFEAVAHIRNIPGGPEDSGFIAGVPEPSTYALLAFGLLGISLAVRRRLI